ncbi:mucin-3A methyl-CpG-binding domain 5 [Octopus vulgaris]|uniref:Mucin-3A methyl-CpG-binding domain 5 n=1 Tax=Octopus vulgaris TaxID=6645 RepID=A0AA36BKJ7_OCTVU|nr:mucin-3A methyl-CpG-binding domain 5 [Octopus vulgaris]
MNSEPGQRNAVTYGSGSNNLQFGGLTHLPITLKTPVLHTGIVTGNGAFPVGIQSLDRGISSIVNVPNELPAGYMSAATVPIGSMPTQFSSLQGTSEAPNNCSIDKLSINYKSLLDSIMQSQGAAAAAAAATLPNFDHFLTQFNQQQQQHSPHSQLTRAASLNHNAFLQATSLELPANLMACIQAPTPQINPGKLSKEEENNVAEGDNALFNGQSHLPELQELGDSVSNSFTLPSRNLPSTPSVVAGSLVSQLLSKNTNANTMGNNSINNAEVVASCNHTTITTTTITTTTSSNFGSLMPAHVHSQVAIPTVTMLTTKYPQPVKPNNSNSQQTPSSHQMNSRCTQKSASATDTVEPPLTSELPFYPKKLSFCSVITPLGWKRVIEEGVIIYYSPSNTRLSSVQQVQDYLSTEGTCKCGLQCPVLVDKVFNFDVSVVSRQWTVNDVNCAEDLTKLCNHKRKIIAMATFQSSQESIPNFGKKNLSDTNVISGSTDTELSSGNCNNSNKNNKNTKPRKRSKSKVHPSPYDGILVSQLLAERDQLKLASSLNSTVLANKTAGVNNITSQSSTPQQPPSNHNSETAQPTSPPADIIKSPVFITIQQNTSEQQNGSEQQPLLQTDALKETCKKLFMSVDQTDEVGSLNCHGSSKLDFSPDHTHPNNIQSPVLNLQSQSAFAALGIQPSPLTIQTVFPSDQFKNQLFLQPSPLTPLTAGHPAFTPYQNQAGAAAAAAAAALNFQLSGNTVLTTPAGFYPQLNQTNSMLFHMQTIGNQKFASPLITQNSLQDGIYTGNILSQLYSPVSDTVASETVKNGKVKRMRSKREKKKYNSISEHKGTCNKKHKLLSQASPPSKYIPASFIDNPVGYLAQQTEIVNGSIASSARTEQLVEPAQEVLGSPHKQGITNWKEPNGNIWVHTEQQSPTSVFNSSSLPQNSSTSSCKAVLQKTSKSSSSPSADHPKVLSPREKVSISSPNSNEKSEILTKSPDTVKNSSLLNASLLNSSGAVINACSTSSSVPGTDSSLAMSSATTKSPSKSKISSGSGKSSSSHQNHVSAATTTQNANKKLKHVHKSRTRPNILSKATTTTSASVPTTAANPTNSTCQTLAQFTISPNINSTSSISPNCLQQILNHSGEFPASNLLSAAARAQLSRPPAPSINVLLGQQIIGSPQINQPLQLNVNLSPTSTNYTMPSSISTTSASKLPCAIGTCFGLTPGQNTPLLFQQAGTSANNGITGGTGLSHNLTAAAAALTNLQQNSISSVIGQSTSTSAAPSPGTFTGTFQTMLSSPNHKVTIPTVTSNRKDSTAQTVPLPTSDNPTVKQGECQQRNKNCSKENSPNFTKVAIEDLPEKLLSSLDNNVLPNMAQCINPQLTNLGVNLMNNQFPFVAMNAPMPPMSLPMVSAVTNTLTHLIPAVGISQTSLNHSPIMQVVGTLGNQSGANPLLIASPLPVNGSSHQQIGMLHSQLSDNLTPDSSSQPQKLLTSPQVPTSTTACIVSNIKENSSNMCQSACVADSVSPIQNKSAPQKAYSDSALSCATNCPIHTKLSNCNRTPTVDKTSPTVANNLSQFSTAQFVVVPNMQMPLLQILGTGIPTEYNKINFSATPFLNPAMDLPTLLSPNHGNSFENSSNIYSLSANWGGLGNTNMSVPLQAVHLQQQLLHMSQLNQTIQGESTFYLDKATADTLTNSDTSDNFEEVCSLVSPCLQETVDTNGAGKLVCLRKIEDSLDAVTPDYSSIDVSGGHRNELSATLKPSMAHQKELTDTASVPNDISEDAPTPSSSLSEASLSCGLDRSFPVSIQERGSKSPSPVSLPYDNSYQSTKHSSDMQVLSSTLCSWSNHISESGTNNCVSQMQEPSQITLLQSSAVDGAVVEMSDKKQTPHHGVQSKNIEISDQIANSEIRFEPTDCQESNENKNLDDLLKNGPSHVFMKNFSSTEEEDDQTTCSYSEDSLSNRSPENSQAATQSSDEPPLNKLNSYNNSSTLNNNQESENCLQKSKLDDEKTIDDFCFDKVSSSNDAVVKSPPENQISCSLETENKVLTATVAADNYKQKAINEFFSTTKPNLATHQTDTIVRRGMKRLREHCRNHIFDDDEDSMEEPMMPTYPRIFNTGDLVWGQIRGFPSWPGKLINISEVKGNQKPEAGKLWVEWFGDHTFTQVEPEKLKTLSEGLEAHHRARKKYRKGRKMNSHLEAAIQEAMMELDHQNVSETDGKNFPVNKGRAVKKRKTR